MRMKRWLALLAAVALLLGALPAAASAEEETEECRHVWSAWDEVEEATCYSAGREVRYCEVCGASESRSISRRGHSYGAWKTTKEATCTQKGRQTRTCRVCGYEDTRTIDRLPHTWGEWTVIEEATDHTRGLREHTCQVCGETQQEESWPEGTLTRGDRGDEVRDLQEALICYGALSGSADGSFGRNTENAIKAVQEAEGLTVDGIAWPQTRALLGHRFGEWVVVSEMTDFSVGVRERTCERCGHVEREEQWPTPLYRRGDKGDGVAELQNALNANGYDCGRADGDFGGRTERAVSAFESDHGIEPDGIAWPGVIKLLGAPDASDAAAISLDVIFQTDFDEIQPGTAADFVLQLNNVGATELTSPAVQCYDGRGEPREEYTSEGTLLPGEGIEFEDKYTFTEADAEKGEVTLLWRAAALANGRTITDEARASLTVHKSAQTPEPEADAPQVAMVKSVTNLPDRGYFLEGEDIEYLIEVHNDSDEDIYGLHISDPLVPGDDKSVAYRKVLPSGETYMVMFVYTVTNLDAADGEVVNVAYADYDDDSDHTFTVWSNSVAAPIGLGEPNARGFVAAMIDKTVTSHPAKEPYYTLGETITYELVVTNVGREPVYNTLVYDTVEDRAESVIDIIDTLNPGETRTYAYSYDVVKEDVDKGEVDNYAWIRWEERSGYSAMSFSQRVTVPTGETEPKPNPKPTPTPKPEKDHCVRQLLDASADRRDYALDYCAEHKPVADAVAALIQQDDSAENWEKAIALWTESLNATYDALFDAATDEEKPILLNNKAQFYVQVAALRAALDELHPDDPALAARIAAEQIMNRTADLCMMLHTAPAPRTDSLNGAPEAPVAETGVRCLRNVEATKNGARYAEMTCSEHTACEAAAMAALNGGATAAWQTVNALWRIALNADTQRLYRDADAEAQPAIDASRTAFVNWLTSEKNFLTWLYAGRSEIVNEIMAQTIRERVLDLCQDAE